MALVVEEVSADEPMFFNIPVTSSPLWVAGKPGNQPTRYRTLGIVTMEDIIEELLGEEVSSVILFGADMS